LDWQDTNKSINTCVNGRSMAVTGHFPNTFSNSSTLVTGAWQVKFWQT
jgi:hypothetical protein